MIVIKTELRGNRAFTSCVVRDKSYSQDGRSIAEALSSIVSDISKDAKNVGRRWMTHDGQVRGVIGDKIAKRRRSRISEMPGFQPHGGRSQ